MADFMHRMVYYLNTGEIKMPHNRRLPLPTPKHGLIAALRHGYQPKDRDVYRAVAEKKIHDTINLLIRGTNPDYWSCDEENPLQLCAMRGDTREARMLLESGADVDTMDPGANTSLHLAALFGHLEMVELLLEHGADVNAMNSDDKSALDFAIKKDHPEIAMRLQAAGGFRLGPMPDGPMIH